MHTKLKRNPELIIADTRTELLAKISNGRHYVKSDFGSGFVNNLQLDESVRVYNIQKHNQKHKQVKRIGDHTIKEKASSKFWTGYAYDINLEELNSAGLKVVQGVRNFTFAKVK